MSPLDKTARGFVGQCPWTWVVFSSECSISSWSHYLFVPVVEQQLQPTWRQKSFTKVNMLSFVVLYALIKLCQFQPIYLNNINKNYKWVKWVKVFKHTCCREWHVTGWRVFLLLKWRDRVWCLAGGSLSIWDDNSSHNEEDLPPKGSRKHTFIRWRLQMLFIGCDILLYCFLMLSIMFV